MNETAVKYDVRDATAADLREFWRATNCIETFAEFESRLSSAPDLAAQISLRRDGELLGLVEVHLLPRGEVWLGVSPMSRDGWNDCGRALFGLVGEIMAAGCPRVWLLITAPEPEGADVVADLQACGWEGANAIPWLRTDGTETTAQWLSLSRETWLCAQQAELN
jgi:hypothetical protein